jgi:hypothetical protein
VTTERDRARGRGRHERAVNVALGAATEAGTLLPTHGALVTTMRALGRQLDAAEQSDSPSAVVLVAKEIREQLVASGMMPTSISDPFAELLEELQNADS